MIKRDDREKKKNTPEIVVSLTCKNDTPVDCGTAEATLGSDEINEFIHNGKVKLYNDFTHSSYVDYYNANKDNFPEGYTLNDYINDKLNYDAIKELGYTYNPNTNVLEKTFDIDIDIDVPDYVEALDFDKIRNSNSSLAPYEQIKEYISNNKDKPEVIRKTVSRLLDDLEQHYDDNKKHKNLPHSSQVFSDALNLADDEQMSGLVCGTIHQQVMTALQECGIPACVVCGASPMSSNSHATLIYKEADGKYIFNNYGNQCEIKANNIQDALSVLNKHNQSFNAAGYYSLMDGKVSFNKFAYKDESVYGKKQDVSDYNNEIVTDFSIADKPAIKADMEVANNGTRAEIGGTTVRSKGTSNSELSTNFAYQKKGETANFVKSQSFGVDVNYKLNKDDKTQVSVEGIVTNVSGHRDKIENITNPLLDLVQPMVDKITEQGKNDKKIITNNLLSTPFCFDGAGSNNYFVDFIEKSTDTSLFLKSSIARKTNLKSTENLTVDNTVKTSIIGGVTTRDLKIKDISGDFRLAVEDGITVKNEVGNALMTNTVSVGVIDDMNLSLGAYNPKLQLGGKFNLASSVAVKPNDNVSFGAEARGYAVLTEPETELGASASVWGQGKLNNKSTVFGKAGVEFEKERLHMGLFNEDIENNANLNVTAGIKINPTTQISASYSQRFDKLNNKRNFNAFNVTFRKSF